MSAFKNIPQHVQDAVLNEIAEHLLDSWMTSMLDEGQYYADKMIAQMTRDIQFRQAFNEYYKLTPTDEDYLEC